jgi:hypothetical protein
MGTATSLTTRPAALRVSTVSRITRRTPATTKPVTVNSAAIRAGVPRALQGEWYWNSDDSVYSDDSDDSVYSSDSVRTRRTTDWKSDIASSRFTFSPEGRYAFEYAVRQRFRAKATESTTREEGTVSFHKDGTLVLTPEQGQFRGNTEGGYVNRRMDADELGSRRLYWEWRGEAGRRSLYLGPSKKSAVRHTSFTSASQAV